MYVTSFVTLGFKDSNTEKRLIDLLRIRSDNNYYACVAIIRSINNFHLVTLSNQTC